MAAVVPVILPSGLPAAVGATPLNPVGAGPSALAMLQEMDLGVWDPPVHW